jgi:hypothetical protein
MTDETCAELKGELETMAKMITALIKGMDRRDPRASARGEE